MSNSDCQSYLSLSEKDIEPALKDLLEKILLYLEKFIETKEDLQQVETELKDYENLLSLINIIKTVFNTLANKIDLKLIKLNGQLNNVDNSHRSIRTDEEYEKLEQIIQKSEAEIRTHIRIEQQLKLYAESVQSKLEESEQTRVELLESTKQLINNLKRENQKFSEQNKLLNIEIDTIKQKLQSLETLCKTLDSENKMLHQRFSQRTKLKTFNDIRRPQSFSDHKLLQNDSVYMDPSTDYPQQSQGSIKQNYLNVTPQKQSEAKIINKSQSKTESDQQKVFGLSMMKSKNSSIQNIMEIISSHQKEKKSVSKNPSSLNHSILGQKNSDSFINQNRSRSQQGTKPIIRQRTETASRPQEKITKLWRMKP